MVNIEYIAKQADSVVKRFETRDPFKICSELGFRIRFKDLGNDIKAYFFCQSRIKNIVINQRTTYIARKILCSHELGHGILHKKLATMRGFHELELFDSLIPTEYEANLFAAELLIDDDELLSLLNEEDKTFFSVAKELFVRVCEEISVNSDLL